MEQNNANWKLADNLKLALEHAFADNVPKIETKRGRLQGLYFCREKNNYVVALDKIKPEEVDAYLELLASSGYELYAQNAIGEEGNECRFFTYRGEEAIVHVSHFPPLRTCKITVMDPDSYVPPVERPEYEAVVAPFVTQPARKGAEQTAPGMSCVFRLSDASFIVIDGGPYDEDDCADLLKFLKDNTPNGARPVIAAWMITHPHGDHMNLANAFLDKYHDEVELRMAAYNFPHSSVKTVYEPLWVGGCEGFIDRINRYYPQAVHYIFHAGQKLYLADAELEILYTHEDLYPTQISWGNHTSAAWSVTINGKKTMILGDCERDLCQQMADQFGSALKSDIMSLSHHGFNGACMDLYVAIDPDICFWPCDRYRFDGWSEFLLPDGTRQRDLRARGLHSDGRVHESFDFNYWLRDDSVKVRRHYHSQEEALIML